MDPFRTHPFFLASGASGLQPAALAIGSKPKATTKLQPLTLHSAVSKAEKSNGKATTSDTRTRSKGLVQPTDPTLPLYTYEGYSPAPAVVYTRHEDEANELAAALTGYVACLRAAAQLARMIDNDLTCTVSLWLPRWLSRIDR